MAKLTIAAAVTDEVRAELERVARKLPATQTVQVIQNPPAGYASISIAEPKDGGDEILLTQAEAAEIRRALASGMRGRILTRWCKRLFADRAERIVLEPVPAEAWLGPLEGPPGDDTSRSAGELAEPPFRRP
jgi:hypothetical protein